MLHVRARRTGVKLNTRVESNLPTIAANLRPKVCEYDLLRLKNVEENLKKMQELGLIPVQGKKQRESRLKARRVKRIELLKKEVGSSEVAFSAFGDHIDPTSISVTRGEEDYYDDDDDVLEHHEKSIETRIDSNDESQGKFTAKLNSFYSEMK
ncbi:hypothetical protein J6590_034321 [Homalodisca vitripennis]|nr:hypothetical protein J6590_034321 [Homalodisca vitripennis]